MILSHSSSAASRSDLFPRLRGGARVSVKLYDGMLVEGEVVEVKQGKNWLILKGRDAISADDVCELAVTGE